LIAGLTEQATGWMGFQSGETTEARKQSGWGPPGLYCYCLSKRRGRMLNMSFTAQRRIIANSAKESGPASIGAVVVVARLDHRVVLVHQLCIPIDREQRCKLLYYKAENHRCRRGKKKVCEANRRSWRLSPQLAQYISGGATRRPCTVVRTASPSATTATPTRPTRHHCSAIKCSPKTRPSKLQPLAFDSRYTLQLQPFLISVRTINTLNELHTKENPATSVWILSYDSAGSNFCLFSYQGLYSTCSRPDSSDLGKLATTGFRIDRGTGAFIR
jgi:hypothetical protein